MITDISKMHRYLLFYPDKQLRIKMKFKCNSCQHVFEHEADKMNVSVLNAAISAAGQKK